MSYWVLLSQLQSRQTSMEETLLSCSFFIRFCTSLTCHTLPSWLLVFFTRTNMQKESLRKVSSSMFLKTSKSNFELEMLKVHHWLQAPGQQSPGLQISRPPRSPLECKYHIRWGRAGSRADQGQAGGSLYWWNKPNGNQLLDLTCWARNEDRVWVPARG